MSEPERGAAGATVVRLEAAQAALRDRFLGWQCRLRQMAVRHKRRFSRLFNGMDSAVHDR